VRIFIKLSFLFCIASFGALAGPVFTGPGGQEVYVMPSQQKDCAQGYYLSGPKTCKKAPAGYYVPIGTNATAPIPCPIGYYGPQAAAGTCIKAPKGTYVRTTAATAYWMCPEPFPEHLQTAQCRSTCESPPRGYEQQGDINCCLLCKSGPAQAGTTTGGAPGG